MRISEKGWVTGKVQGVWFRRFVQQEARLRGVDGYAKNLADGSVEVLLSGDSPAVSAVKLKISEGPPGAIVAKVIWESSPDGGISGFDVR